MSMFSRIFGDSSQQNIAPVAPTNPGNLPNLTDPATQQTPGTASNGVVPANPQGQAPDNSPMAEHSTLWDANPIDPNAAPDPNAPQSLNPADVQKAVASADFTSSIPAEHLAAIAAGGEEAQQALLKILNHNSQQVLAQSTLVNDKVTSAAIDRAIKAAQAKIPEMLRQQAITDHMKNTNPLFSNPAIRPVVEATRTQLAQKFPNASAAEIIAKTQEFITAMGEAFAPAAAPSAGDGTDGQDWTKFLE